MAAPAFKATFSATRAHTGALTLSVAVSNIVKDDFMLLVVAADNSTAQTISTPSGFTPLHKAGSTLFSFYKVAVGGETSVGFNIGNETGGVTATVYVASEALLDASGVSAVIATATPNSPSIDTTGPDRRIIAAFAQAEGTTWTPGSGMTERSDVRSGTSFVEASVMMQDIVQSAQGATGTKSATSTDGSDPAAALTVALKSPLAPYIESVGMLVG